MLITDAQDIIKKPEEPATAGKGESMEFRLLIIEDEPDIRLMIEEALSLPGYRITSAEDGQQALQLFSEKEGWDLVVLDLMLPKVDGLTVLRKIREKSTVPVLILSARNGEYEKVLGLEYGADDYITKPFNILELKARIRALLRRAGITASQPGGQTGHILEHKGLTLDTEKRTAYKRGERVDLTAREFDLAELFLRSPGRVFSRDSLLDLVWGYDYQGDARTVDVHIRRLREKLEDDPASPSLIITKWGVGYYLAE